MPVQGDRRCGRCSEPEYTLELVYQRRDGVWGWSLPLCPACRVQEKHRLEAHGFTQVHTLMP